MSNRIKWVAAVLCVTLVLLLPSMGTTSCAAEDPLVIVSMGDSYSSGEGLEPYYGQDKSLDKRIKDRDWLARRSTISWPALLEVPGYEGTMSDYRCTGNNSKSCQWYFVAAGGAKTANLIDKEQKVTAQKAENSGKGEIIHSYTDYLPAQISIFDSIKDPVDYVTLTIGGNDVGFGNLVKTCISHSSYLGSATMDEVVEDYREKADELKESLKNAYCKIAEAAGPQASIIVVGYPKLLDEKGKPSLYSKTEAAYVNKGVSMFNEEISKVVDSLNEEGLNIYFVDVEAAFDADGGHAAFSKNPWITGIELGTHAQALNDESVIRGYSLHPNAEGAKAYARCVNEKIREIEAEKKKGTVSGKVCTAHDKTVAVSLADIAIYDTCNSCVYRGKADKGGNFSYTLKEGKYRLVISAKSYASFSTYITINKNRTTYINAVLQYEGLYGETGTINGRITHAMTGVGLSGINITARSGLNNTSKEAVVVMTKSDNNGYYTLEVPRGSYCLSFERDGFVTHYLNVVVNDETVDERNVTLNSELFGHEYVIRLTWDDKSMNLDSHMVGKLYTGVEFHVFYDNVNQKDLTGNICTLEGADSIDGGPETITLKAQTKNPYYFYVHCASGIGAISDSKANVEVYRDGLFETSMDIPTNNGTGAYWNVFAIINDRIDVMNTISDSPDCTYYSNGEKVSEFWTAIPAEESVPEPSEKSLEQLYPSESTEEADDTVSSNDITGEDAEESTEESEEETEPDTDTDIDALPEEEQEEKDGTDIPVTEEP